MDQVEDEVIKFLFSVLWTKQVCSQCKKNWSGFDLGCCGLWRATRGNPCVRIRGEMKDKEMKADNKRKHNMHKKKWYMQARGRWEDNAGI